MLSLIRKEKKHVKSVVPKLQGTKMCGSRRDVPLGHFIALNVPTVQQRLKVS